jgi:hypothetical protein
MTPHRDGFGDRFLSFFKNYKKFFLDRGAIVSRIRWRRGRGVSLSESRRSGLECNFSFTSTHSQDEQ